MSDDNTMDSVMIDLETMATGFQQSTLGPDRCTFCDGTEGGTPPEEDA